MEKHTATDEKSIVRNREGELAAKAQREGNLAWLVSRRRSILRFALLALSALLYSSAFPPLNWGLFGWIGIIPLFFMVKDRSPLRAWIDGYVWGYVWSCTSFFFLREIEPFVPFAIAAITALFPAFWAASVPLLKRYLFVPADVQLKGTDAEEQFCRSGKKSYARECVFVLVLASWWCVLEWIRTWIGTGFPWNLLAVTQWKNVPMLQICEFTGVYGLSFLLLFFNISTALSLDVWKNVFRKGKYERPLPFYIAVMLIMVSVIYGTSSSIRLNNTQDKVKINIAVLQGNIPQCRMANDEQAKFALDEYLGLSELAVLAKPDLIIWPETAVPIPYNLAHPFGSEYRLRLGQIITKSKIPFLIGTIDFGKVYGKKMKPEDIPVYNSALLLDSESGIVDTYNKIHLVPFGEYTPWGEYYPWIKEKFGMGRSLSAGKRHTVFSLKDNVRATVNICYEDVFPEISRNCALAGANLLIIISNDAWYPNSSEPEQHLAHAVFRAVETRRPIVRSGNNNGSCVISSGGVIVESLSETYDPKTGKAIPDPLKKVKGFANFNVEVIPSAPLTFYSRYGNVFIYFCGMIC
ncbi:MAG: apolipoprotein N-acyltransferase, partial [Victivallales bacterium]